MCTQELLSPVQVATYRPLTRAKDADISLIDSALRRMSILGLPIFRDSVLARR